MLRKIASLGFLQLVGIFINVLRTKVFAVLLGPSGFGVVATIDQLVLSVVQISNLSLPFTALKFLSRSHSLGESEFRRSYAAFFKAMAILAIVAMLVSVAAVPVILERFDSQLAAFRSPITIALLGIPATMMLMFLVNVLAARQESIQSILLTVVSSAIALLAGAGGFLLGGIIGIYAAAVTGSTALMVAVVVLLSKKKKLSGWIDSSGVWLELKAGSRVVDTALYTYFAVASSSIQLLFARYAVITHVSAEAAGFVQAALAISLAIGAVLGPTNALYLSPYVNRAIPASAKVDAVDQFFPRLVFLYCLGGLPVLLFPELVLSVLFSQQFAPALTILPWFVAWQCLFQIANTYQQLLIGLDDVRGYGWVTVAGNIVATTLCLLLVHRLGMLGIAYGFVIGALVTVVLTGLRLRATHGIIISRSMSALVAVALVGFSVITFTGQMSAELTLFGLLVRLATAVVFLVVLWFASPRSLRAEVLSEISGRWRA